MQELSRYFYSDGSSVFGPVPFSEITNAAKEAGIPMHYLMVVREGEDDWQEFGALSHEKNAGTPMVAANSLQQEPSSPHASIKNLNRHLLLIGGATTGPHDDVAFQRLAEAGFPPDTLARQAGMATWMPVQEYAQYVTREPLVPQSPIVAKDGPLQARNTASPAPPRSPREMARQWSEAGKRVAELASNPFVVGAAQRATESATIARLFASRILKSDFTLVRATDDERKQLESSTARVTSALAQDYAAWRRAVLGLAVVFLGCTVLKGFADLWNIWTGEAPFILKSWTLAFYGTQGLAWLLLLGALQSWTNVASSRLMSWSAWAIQFLGPMILLMVPLSSLGMPKEDATIAGISFVLLLAAKIFGLFPGLIRSALTLKTLLPQGRLTGWVAGAVAPFYSLFFSIITLLTVQSRQTSLAFAAVAFTGAALIPLFMAGQLAVPCNEAEASGLVGKVRRRQVKCLLAGLAFTLYFMIYVLKISMSISLVNALAGFTANMLMVTLASADLIIGLAKKTSEQAKNYDGAPLAVELQQRLDALA